MSAEAGDAKEPYKYVYKQQDDPFSFEIIRSGNQHSSEPIWNTTGTRLIYKEQYLEITSWAPRGSTMYGLGERISTSGERPQSLANASALSSLIRIRLKSQHTKDNLLYS